MLKISNLYKSFPNKKVIDNCNLEIKDGSIFGLVGINGAGKTTLLRMVAGIYQADEGSIQYNNYDTYNCEKIRKDIFFISDDNYFPFASNIETIKMFYQSFYDVDEATLNKYLEIFNLDSKAQINTFSKGMKRQTMLAFALSIKPKLLLLDEAFDGLDPLVRVNLKKALIDFIEDNNATIIISSHNLKELEDICDSYGILSDGKVLTYGDLLESKENINKYQVAFKPRFNEKALAKFNIMHKSKQGSVYTLVIKGNRQEVKKQLEKLNPIVLDVLNVNFEELFIYEQGVK